MIALLMIIYQWALTIFDLVHFVFLVGWLYLVAIFRLFVPNQKKSLSGQVAMVTGAGHGIGKELALQLSRLGVKVVCCDINEAWNQNTVEAIKAEAGVAWGYKCDVSSASCVHDVSSMIRKEVGDIDILINNAGIMPCKSFLQHSAQDVEKLFAINVMSHFHTLREWLPVFMSRGDGHIVALSSIAGLMGTSNLVPYCATKHAIRGLMEGLKEELRFDNRYPGIKLTTVHPFVVETGLAKSYRIRFPLFNPVTTPADAASIIIDGIQREHYVVSIPKKDFYFLKLFSVLPLSIQHALSDLLEAEVDEETDS
ncbi:hypothetical protein HAZT_HAZT011920 [Hyalella azteca]|uniref:Short-chain dehydrogenase/reductase 3 n=1 Tax=Hyalella azteca TaxID=294128 RepID=A0A6A0HAV0_HYAAZ|nr:epidermal retinol dehydrogenase 2 [Hyalella azteca]KAA0202900.1 hypothetical protein HAZT_HAZT011920 [Hyalella azteca]